MTDTASASPASDKKTLPQWSTFGKVGTTKTTYRGREFVLTEAQEEAAQALARGEFVQMARRSGKNIVRARVADILREGGGKQPAAKKSGSTTVFTLTKVAEGAQGQGDDVEILGTFASKTGAKAAANADYLTRMAKAGYDVDSDGFEDLADKWVNGKRDSATRPLTDGLEDFSYEVKGSTLRK